MIFHSSNGAIVRVDWIQFIGNVRPESLGHLGNTGNWYFPIYFQRGEQINLTYETEREAREDKIALANDLAQIE